MKYRHSQGLILQIQFRTFLSDFVPEIRR
ncbi:uncharacterized protein LOC132259876 [Phlebotomus argentipes]|nr:uncharacterized protein LOC132259876 [Phlebotomus argentipes]